MIFLLLWLLSIYFHQYNFSLSWLTLSDVLWSNILLNARIVVLSEYLIVLHIISSYYFSLDSIVLLYMLNDNSNMLYRLLLFLSSQLWFYFSYLWFTYKLHISFLPLEATILIFPFVCFSCLFPVSQLMFLLSLYFVTNNSRVKLFHHNQQTIYNGNWYHCACYNKVRYHCSNQSLWWIAALNKNLM